MKYWSLVIIGNLCFLKVTAAHDGIAHHPETTSEIAHFLAHFWMAFPVIVGAGLLFWGVKRFIAKRTILRKRG